MSKPKTKPFVAQARILNRKISALKLKGLKEYIHCNDLVAVHNRQNGVCSYCGLPITNKEYSMSYSHFRFRIPIELDGEISSDNLVALCFRCYKHRSPKRPPNYPVFGYSAFSDLVVQLVQAVIEKDEDKITYFKAQLDSSLSDFIGTLFYKPLGTPKQLNIVEPYNRVPISESIVKITDEIEKVLKDCNYTKEYKVLRNDE